ncbi:MAG TPA: AraC family transcriptional regulator [Acidimicrobiales bacterium]
MDAVDGLLHGPRASGAFLLHVVMDPPWAVRVQDRAPLSLVAMAGGHAWVVPDRGESARLGPGDVAVLRGPDPYVFADAPATAPQVLVHPGQRCTDLDGNDLGAALHHGVRTWGNSAAGGTRMLVGSYEHVGELGRRLLAALPDLAVVPAATVSSPLVGLLGDEVARDEPGQEVVLDRLLDLLVVTVLRAWFAGGRGDAPGWYRAGADPVVGPALRLLHHEPARPWTVASLAAEVGVSRAALARRFTDLVGQPPMAYLTEWRLDLAAELLLDPGTTIGAVAQRVGYGSAFALSAAFRRVRGLSPREHRQAAAI